MPEICQPTRLRHQSLGDCELVRVDGSDWIVRHLESGAQWRLTPNNRRHFIALDESSIPSDSGPEIGAALEDRHRLLTTSQKKLRHPSLGECVLLRVEGVDWIIRPVSSGTEYRCSPQARRFLTVVTELDGLDAPQAESVNHSVEAEPSNQSAPQNPSTIPQNSGVTAWEVQETPHPAVAVRFSHSTSRDGRFLRRAFESLRNGLPPPESNLQDFAIGMDQTLPLIDRMLQSVGLEGGNACVIRGGYGQGKTFSLKLLQQRALQAGYLVASTEVDAFENQIQKPHHIYRDLLARLRFPDSRLQGVAGLVEKTVEYLAGRFPDWYRSGRESCAEEVRHHLVTETQCEPLAWLLSDPSIQEKELLIGLLACEPGIRTGEARQSHLLRSNPRDWPSFTAGTQGDFASYVISGLGRLARLLDYKGLLVILDEMEKWELLDWKAQCRAGNLFGGLVWGATREIGKRACHRQVTPFGYQTWSKCAHSSMLEHSGRCGGYPFSTPDRCFLGIAVAMTPRGDSGPEDDWSHYGVLEVIDLPPFDRETVQRYVDQVGDLYRRAYDLPPPVPPTLARKAIQRWQQAGDQSARTATLAVIQTLDDWRDQTQFVAC